MRNSALLKQVRLSPRQFEIKALIDLGLSGPMIAERLGIKLSTIKTHRRAIRDKQKDERYVP